MAPARPTILQIIPTLDTGGAELSTVEIAHAIVAGGGRALVATSGGRLAPRIIEAGGEIIPFPADTKNPARMIANARSLAGLIRRENVDLVHARSRAPAWSAFSAARATKRPFVTTYHGAYSENGPLKRAYNSVMARGSPVIANSEFTASLIALRYGTPPGNIRIIHRGVDPSAFDPTTLPAARLDALRHYLGLAPGQPMILHPARLTRWKGQPILIEALALLGQHGDTPPAITVLAGSDQGRAAYTGELRALIRSHGLTANVRLPGHLDDMPSALALASVTVIASTDPEAFGRTAIEAQMIGCPVIATRIGAPPETVLSAPEFPPEECTGWLIPPGDPASLAAALSTALALTPAGRHSLATRARAHATANFSLHAMKLATLRVYDEVLNSRLADSFSASKMPHSLTPSTPVPPRPA